MSTITLSVIAAVVVLTVIVIIIIVFLHRKHRSDIFAASSLQIFFIISEANFLI
jgi:hypothetical protein